MQGVVLAAGMGSRLHPLTADLPKTLLEVAGEKTILDLALENLRSVGVEEVSVVTGFAAARIEERFPAWERRLGLRLRSIANDKALVWNNCYSLWLAADVLRGGALVVNGDTVHPASVEQELLAAPESGVVLAVDARKRLAEEEMKVEVEGDRVVRISKLLDPGSAFGEYIGVTRVDADAAPALVDALEAVWRRDTTLYYEDGYQELSDRGGPVLAHALAPADWVEVDDHADLARAREVACRY